MNPGATLKASDLFPFTTGLGSLCVHAHLAEAFLVPSLCAACTKIEVGAPSERAERVSLRLHSAALQATNARFAAILNLHLVFLCLILRCMPLQDYLR